MTLWKMIIGMSRRNLCGVKERKEKMEETVEGKIHPYKGD